MTIDYYGHEVKFTPKRFDYMAMVDEIATELDCFDENGITDDLDWDWSGMEYETKNNTLTIRFPFIIKGILRRFYTFKFSILS